VTLTAERLRRAATGVALVLVTVVLLLALGGSVAQRPLVGALAAVALMALGVTAVEAAAVPVLAMPLLLVTARVGAGAVDLTVSDAVLALSTVPALLVAMGGLSRPMRNALWLAGLYQAATVFTVIQNPYQANLVEWFHAGVLVICAMLVGWAAGRHGLARHALTLLLVASLVLALSTIAQAGSQYAHGDFSPVYTAWPYHMHKNAVGTICALLGVVAYLRPPWLGWSRRSSLLAFWIFVLALLATQSRQGILGLSVAIFVVVMRRTPSGKRRNRGILLALIPTLAFVSVMVRDQIRSGNQFNAVFQRVTWFQDATGVWLTDPWLGVGLRWWYTDRFPVAFQPPNAELDTLTAAGVVGLAAFLVLLVGTWLIARRIDPAFGIVAELVLLTRFVQSQFDLFWVSMQASLPFVILGICLGALAHHEAGQERLARAGQLLDQALHPTGVRP
jgi:O-antigen ligase